MRSLDIQYPYNEPARLSCQTLDALGVKTRDQMVILYTIGRLEIFKTMCTNDIKFQAMLVYDGMP